MSEAEEQPSSSCYKTSGRNLNLACCQISAAQQVYKAAGSRRRIDRLGIDTLCVTQPVIFD